MFINLSYKFQEIWIERGGREVGYAGDESGGSSSQGNWIPPALDGPSIAEREIGWEIDGVTVF